MASEKQKKVFPVCGNSDGSPDPIAVSAVWKSFTARFFVVFGVFFRQLWAPMEECGVRMPSAKRLGLEVRIDTLRHDDDSVAVIALHMQKDVAMTTCADIDDARYWW